MNGFLRHFDNCNRRDMSLFVPFIIDGAPYGVVRKEIVSLLLENSDFQETTCGVCLSSALVNYDDRSQALARAAERLSGHYGEPLRKEYYAVVRKWGDSSVAHLDRAAVPWFGVKGFGVHVNGYVRKADGIYMWVGERAADRQVDPGKLDNIIGGGLPIGLTVEENLRKEAQEEAGLSEEIVSSAVSVGTISYALEKMRGIRRDTIFVYDLGLPEAVVPKNTDGEVHAFNLLPIAEVAHLVEATDRFKFNCNLIIIDFLFRRGFFENRPDLQTAIGKRLQATKSDAPL